MRILLPLLTRKALLSSALVAPLASVFWAPAPLPEWLLPFEKALLGDMMVRNDEGVSLRRLHETSFEAVRKAIGPDIQVVLLGEATHGSQELYQIRADLTMALIKHEEAFDAVLFEGDFAPFSDLNHFVNGITSSQQVMQMQQFDGTFVGQDNTASKTINDVLDGFECRFPRWMWRNNVMRDFATDVLYFNQQASVGNVEHMPVQLLGLDIYSMFRSIDKVVCYLQDIGQVGLARKARQYYSTLNEFRSTEKEYGKAISEHAVSSQKDNVAQVLQLLCRNENKLRQMHGSYGDELYFDAVQSARVVVASEAYFRQLFQHDIDESIFNVRDSAFLDRIKDTIAFIKQRKNEANRRGQHKQTMDAKTRVIVWAHNSHVADGPATTFSRKGLQNLGQLCRQEFGSHNVFTVGLTTFHGTVRAAPLWDEPDHVVKLKPAFESSHESVLHIIAKRRGENAFGYVLKSNYKDATNSDGEVCHVDETARAIFDVDRLQRFVGVEYNPETELRSNYNMCNMSKEFDCILHVDHSTALRVENFDRQ